MTVREVDNLKKEYDAIVEKFKELMNKSKYLVHVIDTLKKENEHMTGLINNYKSENESHMKIMDNLRKENEKLQHEICGLQNHNTNLTLTLNERETSGSDIEAKTQYAVEYLLKRSKAGIRPSELNRTVNEYSPKVCLVSSLPKSGTWANQYFWSVYDSLCNQSETYDPYDAFFMRLEGLGVDVFGVAHMYCPGFINYAGEDIKEKLAGIKYPSALNFDWGSKYMKDVGIDKACDPWLNENVKIAFIYRNPLDQVLSYARVLWDQKIPKKEPFDNVHDENGNIIKIDNVKDYIRLAGAASYVYYFMTYHVMKDILGDRLLFMRYEDIVRNRYEKYKEIAEFFIGPEIHTSLKEQLIQAEEITRIENMKLLEKSSGRTLMHNYKAPKKGAAHVHDGSIGQWKKVLDQDDIDFIFKLLDDFGINKNYFLFE